LECTNTLNPLKKYEHLNDKVSKILNEFRSGGQKTPVIVINEIMMLLKKSVVYNLVSVTVKDHALNFLYTIQIDEMRTFGRGSSKINAKQHAALNFLENFEHFIDINAITPNRAPTNSDCLNNPTTIKKGDITNKNSLKIKYEINPIGFLQELCMARYWEFPKYKVVEINEGYKVVCSLRVYTSECKAINKKAAKRQAAFFMVQQVVDLPLGEKNDIVKIENGEHDVIQSISGLKPNNNTLNDTEEPIEQPSFMSTTHYTYIDTVFQKLKSPKKDNNSWKDFVHQIFENN
jgi:hypothetical protein